LFYRLIDKSVASLINGAMFVSADKVEERTQ